MCACGPATPGLGGWDLEGCLGQLLLQGGQVLLGCGAQLLLGLQPVPQLPHLPQGAGSRLHAAPTVNASV